MQQRAGAEIFEEHRPMLIGLAYRMLGSVAEAEDVVQDAFLRYSGAQPDEVRSPRGYLVTIVTRLCLDVLKSARVQREQYIGPWLPEPLVTQNGRAEWWPETATERDESISMAYLVLLETLTPAERAVFLLREVFDYDYHEIAGFVDKTEANCRQLFRRARGRLAGRGDGDVEIPCDKRRLVERFSRAVGRGDMNELLALLTEDVRVISDGGAKVSAATRVVSGRDRKLRLKAARLILGVARKQRAPANVEIVELNASPGLILRDAQGRVTDAMVFEFAGELLRSLRVVRNPAKLSRL